MYIYTKSHGENVLEKNLLGHAQYFLDNTGHSSMIIISIQEASTTAS